jgi:CHAT domain-containing protein/tetratricopeptide (TPR) repeat protein
MRAIFLVCCCLLFACSYSQNKIFEYQNKIEQFKKNGDTLSLNYTFLLNDIGEFYYNQNNYSQAEIFFKKSLQIKNEIIGENHDEFAYSLNNLGALYGQIGRYLEAEKLLMKSLKIRLAISGNNNSKYLKTSENIAIIYAKQGKYSLAEPIFLDILNKIESVYGQKSKEYLIILGKVAFFYRNKGDFYKAETLLLKGIEITKYTSGENNINYYNAIDELGQLYRLQGKYLEAEKLFSKSLNIINEILGKKNKKYVSALNNLASVYQSEKKYSQAEELYLKVIEIYNLILKVDKNDDNYAVYLNNLASLYDDQGKFFEAQKLYNEALSIKNNIFGDKSLSYSITLKNLALSYREQGNFLEAEKLFLESLDIKKKVLGVNHQSYILNILNLAVLYRQSSNDEKSSYYFEEFIKNNQVRIKDDVFNLSERELLQYIDYNNSVLFSPLSFIYEFSYYNSLIKLCYENELLLKNLTLSNNLRLRNLIKNGNSNELKDKFEYFLDNKKQIQKLEEIPVSNRPNNLMSLKVKTEQIEKELIKESTAFAKYENSFYVKFDHVKAKLLKNEVSINVVNFNYYKKRATDSIIYSAFVIKKDSKFPKFIPLFEEKQLTALLEKNKSQPVSSIIDIQYLNKQISELILKPIENELKGITTIYLSLSGSTHQINVAALPINENQTFGQKYKIHILNSPSELIDYTATSFDKKDKLDFILYGNIDYDKRNIISNKDSDDNQDFVDVVEEIKDLQTRSGISSFGYLSGTKNEIENISTLANKSNLKTIIFEDRNATEESIKQLDGRTKPFVLHLATHGFFFPDPVIEMSNDFLIEGKSKVFKTSDDPMMRSGLVFSGANKYWGKVNENLLGDDGILTASEISNLDLSACELVVLSACETGLGEVKGSEGVFGLQRAFKMAGVKNIIMSLWKVPDAQTAELFDTFYSECFAGKTIHEAFHSAQAKMKTKYSPYYWAGFVLLE